MSLGAVVADGLRLGFGTFTALPTPHPRTVDRARGGVAVVTAALPGALLGLIGGAVGVGLCRLGVPPLAAAALAVGAVQLACRGFHLDGLGDTADGLASGLERERALMIMHSGDSGPAAVVTLVLVLVAQVASLSQILAQPGWRALAGTVAVVALSRAWLVLPCLALVPLARSRGLGAGVGRSVPPGAAVLALTVTGAAVTGVLTAAGWPWWVGPAAVAAAGLAAGVVVAHAVRRLAGVTGDVMGAVVEIALTAALLVLSIL